MQFENFNGQSNAGTAETSTRLLGDTWAPRVQQVSTPPSDGTNTNTPNQAGNDRAQTNGPTDQTQTPEQTQETQTPEQLLNQMIKDASEGNFNDTAQELMLRSLQAGGLQGMMTAAQEMNRRLQEAGSEYRVSIAAQVNRTTGEANIGVALTKPNEDTPAILRDIITNGENSQYIERGMQIQVRPSKPPGQDI